MSICNICPRGCRVPRRESIHGQGAVGYCRTGMLPIVSRAALHHWEEPCISGTRGAGTVFFAGCNLSCVYCQNYEISELRRGIEISVERLAEIYRELIARGAHNIDLVTPTHFTHAVFQSLKEPLPVPVVYNCGGYESVDTLKMLDGYIDIYLPDFKYADSVLAKKYSKAEDYPIHAKRAIDEMVRQVGGCEFDENGMMKRGIIIRHLVLPSYTDNSKRVIKYLYNTYGDDIYMSIMSQYTPMPDFTDGGRLRQNYPELGRRVRRKDYDEVVDYAIDLGVTNAFIQEGDVAKDSFIPDFDSYEGV